MTWDMYTQPKVMTAISWRSAFVPSATHGAPTDLSGPYVTAGIQVGCAVTTDDTTEVSGGFSLLSRAPVRVVSKGSTIVMKAINQNSGKQLRRQSDVPLAASVPCGC